MKRASNSCSEPHFTALSVTSIWNVKPMMVTPGHRADEAGELADLPRVLQQTRIVIAMSRAAMERSQRHLLEDYKRPVRGRAKSEGK
jgi:hypothetical protein